MYENECSKFGVLNLLSIEFVFQTMFFLQKKNWNQSRNALHTFKNKHPGLAQIKGFLKDKTQKMCITFLIA